MTRLSLTTVSSLLFLLTTFDLSGPTVVGYDIVYVRAPRFGDTRNASLPEVFNPVAFDAGADLLLLHPDGTEDMLVAGGAGAVTDPAISFDGQWCYYAYVPDVKKVSARGIPLSGSDIYRINLKSRVVQRLTHQEFTPNTGAAPVPEVPGVFNLGPSPVGSGRIAFTSTRNGFIPAKPFTTLNLQMFVMDEDGENVTPITPMTLGSALHPMMLKDGRLSFSSYESQGLRDERLWALWSIYPDGRHWEPLVSAFQSAQSFHFAAQLSNEDVVIEDYYNANNNGFGAFLRFPIRPPAGGPRFGSAGAVGNSRVAYSADGIGSFFLPFGPKGIISATPFTHPFDMAAPAGANGMRLGKVTHPSSAPNNDLLLVWTPGPANNQQRPTSAPYYDAGLYLARNGGPVSNPADLILIKNDPKYNELSPRAVVPYKAIYGVDEPVQLPWLPNDGTADPSLPAGTPYGIIGTSSFYKRESAPGFDELRSFNGLDGFYTNANYSSNWIYQGSDAGRYSNADIFAVRIVMMEPTTARYGNGKNLDYYNSANERMRILGEIPLRWTKPDGSPVLDADGNPDTSFWARIPADTPFTFQMLDRNGMVLTMAQTWHQVRPGEIRTDCGGCHAHSQSPTAFAGTAASKSPPVDLTTRSAQVLSAAGGVLTPMRSTVGAVDVEFYRDIRPLLARSCVSCHRGADAPGRLQLDDTAMLPNSQIPGDYARLAFDAKGQWGYPAQGKAGFGWGIPNLSRYVRVFQSRRSLLIWKLYGKRLDGWKNEDHPTESVLGDPSTYPAGVHWAHGDIDYTGAMMPPVSSGALTDNEKFTFARWIDLGCPIDLARTNGHTGLGWFLDDLRPTLTISRPRPNENRDPLTEIRIGVADAYSGIDASTLSVIADVQMGGHKAGSDLAKLGAFIHDGIFSIPLAPPLTQLDRGHLTVKVRDRRGNLTTQVVRFSVRAGPAPTSRH